MVRDILKEIFGSTIGKAGVLLLAIILGFTVFAIPLHVKGFGTKKWNNPVYWADYPKSAPPAEPSWAPYTDETKTKHQVFTKTSPDTVEKEGRVKEFRFRAALSSGADPTFLSFTLTDVMLQDAPPVFEVYLESETRRLFLYRHVVPGKSPDETGRVTRYRDVPFRSQLTGDATAKARTGAFFDQLRQEGKDQFTAVVRAKFADPRDTIGSVKFVVGGNAYGWLGTDSIGRDIWQGMLFGLPLALLVGLATAFFTTLIGAALAGIGCYRGGFTDAVIQRIIDVKSNIPTLVLLIFLAATIGSKLAYVIAFMILFGWGGLTIYLRSWMKQIRETGFIMYARLRGLSGTRIIFRHLIPQTTPFLFVFFLFTIAGAILTEAGLSVLGLGDPSLPTWGQMIQQAFQTGAHSLGYWWWMVSPIVGIIIVCFPFCLFYLVLESYAEPRLKKD